MSISINAARVGCGQADALRIRGGVPLSGEVEVFGSKKSLPKVLVASLLTDDRCEVADVSWIEDLIVASSIVEGCGRTVRRTAPRTLEVSGPCSGASEPCGPLAGSAGLSRVPAIAIGAQLVRFGEAWMPPLGGDRIGRRSIDWHLNLLRALGASIDRRGGWLHATASGLRGTTLDLPFPMVGVTEQMLLTGSLSRGTTLLRNAAIDPEIEELVKVLREMGARIEVDGPRRAIRVEGVAELGGFEHRSCSDRFEAGSWASAALATHGDIVVRGARPDCMSSLLATYREAGGTTQVRSDGIRFVGARRRTASIRVDTGPFPAFESDWQSPMLVALSQVAETSLVHETVFEERLAIASALREAGACVEVRTTCGTGRPSCLLGQRRTPHLAVVRGSFSLQPVHGRMRDLRAGFGLVLIALAAVGESLLAGSMILARGYEDFIAKLKQLGGEVNVPA